MTKSLLLFISLSLLIIGGCKDNCKPPPVKPTPPTQTLADKVADLETSGRLPTLDRSNDIAGPDLDDNGIRDDVDAYINKLDLTEPQRKAARQMARATQRAMMTDTNSDAALRAASKNSFRAIKCLSDQYEDSQAFIRLSKSIQSITANTKVRAKTFNEYNAAQSGSISRLPNGDTCEE